MKSNFNLDIKFNADKVLDVLSTGLSKYTDKIVGKNSGGSGGNRGQGNRGGRDVRGSGAQSRGRRRKRR